MYKKKWFVVYLLLLMCFVVSCNNDANDEGERAIVCYDEFTYEVVASGEEAEAIRGIIENGKWENGVLKFSKTHIIVTENAVYERVLDHNYLFDRTNDRRLELTDEQAAEIDRILGNDAQGNME